MEKPIPIQVFWKGHEMEVEPFILKKFKGDLNKVLNYCLAEEKKGLSQMPMDKNAQQAGNASEKESANKAGTERNEWASPIPRGKRNNNKRDPKKSHPNFNGSKPQNRNFGGNGKNFSNRQLINSIKKQVSPFHHNRQWPPLWQPRGPGFPIGQAYYQGYPSW